jgi:hypothetical protein
MAGINVSLITAGTAYWRTALTRSLSFGKPGQFPIPFVFLPAHFLRPPVINDNGDVVGYYYAFADTNPSEPAQSFRSHAIAAGGHKGSVRT